MRIQIACPIGEGVIDDDRLIRMVKIRKAELNPRQAEQECQREDSSEAEIFRMSWGVQTQR